MTRGLCNRCYQAWYREHRADRKRDSDRRWRERVDYNGQRRKALETRVCEEPGCGNVFETGIPHNCPRTSQVLGRTRRAAYSERDEVSGLLKRNPPS